MAISNRSKVASDGSVDMVPRIADGEHVFKFEPGIRLLEPNEYGQSLVVPMSVAGPDDNCNNMKHTQFFAVSGDNQVRVDASEDNLCSWLDQVGLADELDKILELGPNDSIFDQKNIGRFVDILGAKLPDRYIKGIYRTGNNGKGNIWKTYPIKPLDGKEAAPAGFGTGHKFG